MALPLAARTPQSSSDKEKSHAPRQRQSPTNAVANPDVYAFVFAISHELFPADAALQPWERRTRRASAILRISIGPSVIIMLRWSRQNFSIGRSVASPMPP